MDLYNINIMRKINTTPYKVNVRTETEEKEIDYNIKNSIITILFQPALKLSAVELLKQNKLAEKVASSGDELLLEEEEYTRLKIALDALEGLSRNDVEFVTRILEASSVEVEAK